MGRLSALLCIDCQLLIARAAVNDYQGRYIIVVSHLTDYPIIYRIRHGISVNNACAFVIVIVVQRSDLTSTILQGEHNTAPAGASELMQCICVAVKYCFKVHDYNPSDSIVACRVFWFSCILSSA